jgi:two-component system sensor histidine kinase DesK
MTPVREIDYPFRSGVSDRARWRRFSISLLWMSYPLVALFASHPSVARAVVALAAWVTFLVCYAKGIAGPWERFSWRRRLAWIAAGCIPAVLLTTLERPDWGILFIFLAVVSGARLPERLALAMLAVLAALAGGAMLVGGSNDTGVISVVSSVAGIGFLFVLLARLAHANIELQAAQDELAAAAVSEERVRFARDLHDLLGHSLSVISLKAQLAGRLLPDQPQEAASHVADLQAVTRGARHEVRAAVAGYARPTLEGELAGARTALEAAGIEPRIGAPIELPAVLEEVLAWSVREGTTNVLRHATARHARILVAGGGATASVEVVDDGTRAGGNGSDGRGLAGLRERAQRVGGRVEAGPAPDGGFRLLVEVPLG